MRNEFLKAMTIFISVSTSVWSQDQPLFTPGSPQAASEGPTTFVDLPPESLDQNETQWVTLTPSNPGNRYWGGADFLLWAIKAGNSPPLASTGALGPWNYSTTRWKSGLRHEVRWSIHSGDLA
jgi:hypothetical protein